jgi:4-hydroxy 2-oxovalerate aldolase
LSDAKRYQLLDKPLILPKHRFSADELAIITNCELLDYGLDVIEHKFSANHTHAIIPHDITTAYVLAMLLESKPKSISSVGFDGFENNDPRQQEMNEILELYNQIQTRCNVLSLTPTTYPMPKGSIYAPNL